MPKMVELIGDSFTQQFFERDEVNVNCSNDRYFQVYAFEGDNDPRFIETWQASNGSLINVITDNEATIFRKREAVEKRLGIELITLKRLRIPYYFYKQMYE